MATGVGIAPTPPAFQTGVQTDYTIQWKQWCAAILRHGEFRQQMDPMTGEFTQPDPGGYSPAALVFLSFAEALGKAAA